MEHINIEDYLNRGDFTKEFDNRLLNYALHYSKIGYPVIPLQNVVEEDGVTFCSCKEGINCPNAGKHPRTRNGSKDATIDQDQIVQWWHQYPLANIGLLTGKEVGFFVLDIDKRFEGKNPYNGEFSLEALADDFQILLGNKNFSPLPKTLTAISGSGSRHIYFQYPLDLRIRNSSSVIGVGLDIKSDNNYIIAPPSNHKSGKLYRWFNENTPIKDAPNWLIYEILRVADSNSEKASTSKLAFRKNSKSKIPKGARNDYIFKQTCGLINSFTKKEVLEKAIKINREKFEKPMKEKEIKYIVNWCWKRYRKKNDLGLNE